MPPKILMSVISHMSSAVKDIESTDRSEITNDIIAVIFSVHGKLPYKATRYDLTVFTGSVVRLLLRQMNFLCKIGGMSL